MSDEISVPWRDFLEDIDKALYEQVVVHCLGGFAMTVQYGVPRRTGDLDYIETVPHHGGPLLERIAGEGTELSRKHRLTVERAGGVANLPASYRERLIDVFGGVFRHLRLFVLDPHDLALSKLSRNAPVDQADVEFLAQSGHLDPRILRERYTEDFRPYAVGDLDRDDRTLDLWIEWYFTP
jgi:hypothetical protein